VLSAIKCLHLSDRRHSGTAPALPELGLAQTSGIPHGSHHGSQLPGSGNSVVHGGHARALVF